MGGITKGLARAGLDAALQILYKEKFCKVSGVHAPQQRLGTASPFPLPDIQLNYISQTPL